MEVTRRTLKRTNQTAEHFSVSLQTIWRWRQQEGFPTPLKRGGIVLFDIDAINDWLSQDKEKRA